MTGTPTDPEPGDIVIDATPIQADLRDLPPGATSGHRTEQEGLPDVIAEIAGNQGSYGRMAGVLPTDVEELLDATQKIARIRKFRRAVDKLAQTLADTESDLDNRRHQIISAVAGAVDKRSRREGHKILLRKYEKTRAYRSAAANKAVRTRQQAEKKAAAQKNGQVQKDVSAQKTAPEKKSTQEQPPTQPPPAPDTLLTTPPRSEAK